MRAIRRATLAHIGIVASMLWGAAVHAQQLDADKQPPFVDNKWLMINPRPITRSADGMRINVPLGFTHMQLNGDEILLVTVSDADALDKTGARCGFDFGNSSVAGLASSADRKDALLMKIGDTRNAVISMQCDRAAKGEFFMLSVDVLIYVGKSEQAVRISAGWPYLPAAPSSE